MHFFFDQSIVRCNEFGVNFDLIWKFSSVRTEKPAIGHAAVGFPRTRHFQINIIPSYFALSIFTQPDAHEYSDAQ
jgi:hypothetical protein